MRCLILLVALATHAAAAQSVPIDTLEARLRAFAADLGAPRPDSRTGWNEAAVDRAYRQHLAPLARPGLITVELATEARYDGRTGLLTLGALPDIAAPPQVEVQMSSATTARAAAPRPDAFTASGPDLLGTARRPAVRLGAAEWRSLAPGSTRIASDVRLGFEWDPPRERGQPYRLRLAAIAWRPAGAYGWEWRIRPRTRPTTVPSPPTPAPSPLIGWAPAPPPSPPRGDDEVLDFSEVQPVIVGGMEALNRSVEYPPAAIEARLEGRVIIQFIVSRTGEPTDISVVRSVHPLLDAEAVRAIKASRFEPGRQNGRAIRVRTTLPITFTLR